MPRLRFGSGISRINDSDGHETIGRESPVAREGFVSNQFQEIRPIGLIMNDRLRVIAVSGEVVERTGDILFKVGEPCRRGVGERDTSSSKDLISFSFTVGVGVNYWCNISWW